MTKGIRDSELIVVDGRVYHIGQAMGYRLGTICPVIANRPKGTFMADYSPAVDKCIDVGLKAMHKLYKTSK